LFVLFGGDGTVEFVKVIIIGLLGLDLNLELLERLLPIEHD